MSERDEGLSARDAEVLESLYRDSPEPSDEDAELRQLQQLRSVFAELKAHQDEPPPAGMALLMAAARQAAQERRPAGLWARLRAGWSVMLAHPAMSAVAAAVVVVGVGGYLVSRGVRPVAEQAPAVSRSEPRPIAPPSGEEAAELGGTAAPAATTLTPAAPALEQAAPALEQARSVAPAEERKEHAAVKRPVTKDANRESLELKKRAGAPTPKDEQAPAPTARPVPKLQEQWQAESEAPAPAPVLDAAATKPSTAPAKAPPPPKLAKPAPAPLEPDADASRRDKGAAGRGSAPSAGLAREAEDDGDREETPSRAQRWYELAKAAAGKGDCDAVKLLATRVKSEDPAFYEARFRKDAAIAKCL